MPKDWNFKTDDSICNVRSVGILIRGNKLLVQHEKDGNEYALPGGHVYVGETAEATLQREFIEETGATINCERMVFIEEIFWKWEETPAHTIAFYFLVHLENEADISDDYIKSQKDNCNIILGWKTFEELKELTLYPEFMKDKILELPTHIEHFVTYE